MPDLSNAERKEPLHMTTTTEAKALLAAWADQAYRHQAEQVTDNLVRLTDGLKVHEASQAENPRDWAYVGDLTSWNERLSDILNNPEVEDADPFAGIVDVEVNDGWDR